MNNPIKTTQNASFNVYNASAGSGKTFTLVKEYIKILLTSSQFGFQNILAITFTNKAASEMKNRVIESLRAFSKPTVDSQNEGLFKLIIAELDMEESQVRSKSTVIIKNILNNYSAFNITTIDSFTYKLVRSFAFDLGLGLNFEVEMDATSLINEAIDVLISRIGEDKEITNTLINYAISKANEDKSWDITRDLQDISKLLLNEDDQKQLHQLKDKNIPDFIALQKNIKAQLTVSEKQFHEIGKQAINLIDGIGVEHKDFISSQLPKHFLKLRDNIGSVKGVKNTATSKNIDLERYYAKSKSPAVKSAIDGIILELIALYRKSETLFQDYFLNKLLSRSIIPLAVLRSIDKVLTEIKEENNIRLNSEFNQLISSHIKEQPAAFIYEKIGEKFQHFFIDEMQDTSVLQWENLIPLLDNVLESENIKSEKGSLMLVGDAKQAIYRWRGGKAEQFIELSDDEKPSPFFVNKNVNQLETNYRSYSQVIEFNNLFFQFLGNHLQDQSYRNLYQVGNQQKQNTKNGGFVQVSFIEEKLSALEKDTVYPEKILEIINNLDKKFNKKEICILARTRKQGVAIAEYLTKEGISITSSETLLLQNSPKVCFIVDLLGLLHQPNDSKLKLEVLYFLYEHYNINTEKHTFLAENIPKSLYQLFTDLNLFDCSFNVSDFHSMAFYDAVEYIIRAFGLAKTSNAYIQFFLDIVLNISLSKTDGITSFFNYWEEKKEKLSIVVPEGKNAVRIMTIHKSKGLEFPVVIFAFDYNIYNQQSGKVWYDTLDKGKYNDFKTIQINYSVNLKEAGSQGEYYFKQRREELELDSFNMLYVALTRAKEQLYVVSELKKETNEPKWFSEFFINFLVDQKRWNENKMTYSFGDSIRKSNTEVSKIASREQKTFISSYDLNKIKIVPRVTTHETDDARQYGTMLHEILSKVITFKDVERAVSYLSSYPISDDEKENIKNLILKIVQHNELHHFFTDEFKIMNERSILTETGEVIIPDRLVFDGNNVTIIDYKTGEPDKKHHHQLNNYAEVLEKMDYVIDKKILIYIDDEVRVEKMK